MPDMSNKPATRFVAGGGERIVAGETERIRREVRERYANALAKAGFFQRFAIRRKIRKEIKARLTEPAPPRALYARR
jgi:hypothetical protein